MKQRQVILQTEYKGHLIEVVRVTAVLDAPGRKMKVERRLQAFIDQMPLKYEESERSGLQEDLLELARAIADQMPPRLLVPAPDDPASH